MSQLTLVVGCFTVVSLAACSVSDGTTPVTAPIDPAEASATLARGQMLVRDMCASCHGADLEGLTLDAVACPSLRAARNLTRAQVDLLLLEGKDPSGRSMHDLMKATRELPLDDVHAVEAYLHTWYGP